MPAWEAYLNENKQRFVDELVELASIPSISALSEHAPDVARAAEWVANRMTAAGVENVRIMPTGGHPVVYGDWLHAPGKSTILIYGHFDVQPVDPVNLWTTPPFEPSIRDGRLYARGATDDKGNMLGPIIAAEALLKTTGKLPVNVKFIFEGQEEIGSPQLGAFVAANKDLLACDVVLNADSGQFSETEPQIGVGLRGLAAIQIDVQGARSDLHSGMYGGAIANPLHALIAILDSMHAPDGTITVEGFYDDVVPLTPEVREEIARIPYDEEEYKAEIGITDVFGEPGYTTHERLWVRPTLEIVGIWGGFQGEGIKTVLAREAHGKIACRLAPNQKPERIRELLVRHVETHTPPGVTVTVQSFPFQAYPYLMPLDLPTVQVVSEVLTEMYGREPYQVRSGGSVPVTELFHRHLGAYSVGLGFGLHDEQIHAPNEFFRLSSFEKGPVAYCMTLEKLGGA
ncbi:MAG: dipeptidase [Anaerolineae bacterium]